MTSMFESRPLSALSAFYANHDCAMCRTARVGEDGVYIAAGFEFCRGCALRIAEVIDLATGRVGAGLST